MHTNALVKRGTTFQLFTTLVYVSAFSAVCSLERQKCFRWFWAQRAQGISNPHDQHAFFTEEPNTELIAGISKQKSRSERPGLMSWRFLGNTQLPLRSLWDQRHCQGSGGPTRTAEESAHGDSLVCWLLKCL